MRQFPGNGADLDFRPVVRDAFAFLLVARHVEEVAQMEASDAFSRKVPEVAKQVCAFFRVWWCVCAASNAAALLLPSLSPLTVLRD